MSGNTQELQWRSSPAQKWFMAVVQRAMDAGVSSRHGSKLSGQRIGNSQLDLNRQMRQSKDPQGMYIFGADGTPYAFCNDHGPEDIQKMMDIGLKRFRENPPQPVTITEDDKKALFSINAPAGAEVLQVFSRIPSPPKSSSYLNKGVGRDFCWIYQEEIKEIVKLAKIGSEFSMPESVTRRLARFHFVDGVRGTPNMWKSSEVKSLSLEAKPNGSNNWTLAGKFSLRTSRGNRKYAGKISGTIAIDPQSGTLSRVRILSDGIAAGAGTYTPNQPRNPYRLLVGFLDTEIDEARIVPPEEVVISNTDRRYKNP